MSEENITNKLRKYNSADYLRALDQLKIAVEALEEIKDYECTLWCVCRSEEAIAKIKELDND